MKVNDLRKRYDAAVDKYKKLESEIRYILEHKIKETGFPIHQITGRVKEFDSIIEKANRIESDNPFEDVLDICGIRVICLFLTDLQRIGKIVESSFVIHTKDDKIYSETDAFGYMSLHYIGSLPGSYSGPRYDDIKDIKFEIQLRTISMHAWATISHYLDYKSPLSIPSPLRKDFNALGAMYYVADQHFEMFFRSSQEAKKMAEDKASRLEIGEEEINLNTLAAYLKMKYKGREHSASRNVSELVEELQIAGYRTISQLDEVIRKGEKAFFLFEEKETEPRFKFSDIGFLRGSLFIADENYQKLKGAEESFKRKCRKYRNKVDS